MSDPHDNGISENIQRSESLVVDSEASKAKSSSINDSHAPPSSVPSEEAVNAAVPSNENLVIDGVSLSKVDFHTALHTFYCTHNPERLGDMTVILKRYHGREEQLVKDLKKKYSVSVLAYAPQASAGSSATIRPQALDIVKPEAGTVSHSNPGSPAPGSGTSSTADPSMRIAESMQQMSQLPGKLFNAISLRTRTYMHDDGSSPDDNIWLVRIRELEEQIGRLQQDKQTMSTSYQKLQTQMFNSKKDKESIEAEVQELKRHRSTLQTNVARLVESEARLTQANSEQAEQMLQLRERTDMFEKRSAAAAAQVARKDLQLRQCLELEDSMAAQLNFLTSRILLCHNITDWHTVQLTSQESKYTDVDADLQEYDIVQLRSYVQNLRASWRSTRAELREALAEKEKRDAVIKQQHETSLQLEANVAELRNEVDTLSKSSTDLCSELAALKSEHEVALRRLADSTEKEATQLRQLEELKAQLHTERTSSSIDQQTRHTLLQVCTDLVQDAQVRAGHAVAQLSERLVLEREDLLSHFHRVKFDEDQVRNLCKKECEAELERFSTELFQCRQRETLKDREIRHLQMQLTEAAERIVKLESQITSRSNDV